MERDPQADQRALEDSLQARLTMHLEVAALQLVPLFREVVDPRVALLAEDPPADRSTNPRKVHNTRDMVQFIPG